MLPKKFRTLSAAVTAGSLALAVAAITASSGTSQAATHAVLTAQTESFPPVNLDNCPTLYTGYPPGGCVAQLQTELNTILGLSLPVDGTFGPATESAVERFQQEHDIVPAEGIVGPETKAALDNPGSSSAATPAGQLNPGQEITSGTQIASPDGKFVLQMQSDGNLVIRAPGNIPFGDTHTAGHDGAIAVMQTDGNFVLIAPGNIPVWASGTDGHPGTVLQVQDDGGVVLYAPGHQVLRVIFPAFGSSRSSVTTPAVPPASAPASPASAPASPASAPASSPPGSAPPASPNCSQEATQGPPSASIPPGQQSYFQCQPPGQPGKNINGTDCILTLAGLGLGAAGGPAEILGLSALGVDGVNALRAC
jgi:peptidoglycan hydrolase-like protein with peptidoglycan-binding domain